jgi:soluble lytic murein transglycosylase-like protein
MADPPDGLLGRLFPGVDANALYGGALSDPATQAQMGQRGLLAMAGSFADSAMPTRMPTPLGAVLGHAAAALGTSGDAVMAARLQAAQAQQASAQSQLVQQRVGLLGSLPTDLQNYYAPEGSGGGAATPGPAPATAGGATGGPIGPIIGSDAGGTQNILSTYGDFIQKAAATHGVDPNLIAAVINTESSGDPNSVNKVTGASGLGNLMPSTAKELGVKNIFDPEENINAVAKYLKQGLDAHGGDTTQALKYYYGGPNQKAWGPNTANYPNLVYKRMPTAVVAKDGATQTAAAAAPPGLLDVPKATGQMNAPPPGVAAAPPGDMTGPPPGAGPINVGPSTLAPLPPGAAGAPIPPPPGGPPSNLVPGLAPPPPGLLGPGAGMPSPNIPPLPPPPPPGPPPSLVTAPPPAPPVPPPAMPQPPPQVAAAPPPAAPGAIPGAPSAQKIRQAQIIAMKLGMAGLPIPPDIEAVAKFGLVGPTAAATEAAKQPYTAVRPGSSFPQVGAGGQITGWTQAPSAPIVVDGPPDAEGRPTKQLLYPPTTPGALPAQVPLGATGASPRDIATQQTQGKFATGVPGEPIGPPGIVPQGIDPTKPIPSPANAGRSYQTVIPPVSQQARTPELETYGKISPDWQKESGEISNAGTLAERAETNLTALAAAYQMVQSGTWAMQKAEFAGYLKAAGLTPPGSDSAADLANLQIAMHNNYKQTLQQLAAANKKFTGNEFKINSDAGESAGNQPAANLTLLSQDLGQVRQIKSFATDWNQAQTMVANNGQYWVNPFSFKTAWMGVNPLQPMIDQARKEFPLKGTPGWVPPAGSSLLPAAPPVPAPGATREGTYNPQTKRIEFQ